MLCQIRDDFRPAMDTMYIWVIGGAVPGVVEEVDGDAEGGNG